MRVVEGTPQGGPLSPLLSNVVLDELDRELDRRGLRFVRYADDANIYVRSRRAGERVMEATRRGIEGLGSRDGMESARHLGQEQYARYAPRVSERLVCRTARVGIGDVEASPPAATEHPTGHRRAAVSARFGIAF